MTLAEALGLEVPPEAELDRVLVVRDVHQPRAAVLWIREDLLTRVHLQVDDTLHQHRGSPIDRSLKHFADLLLVPQAPLLLRHVLLLLRQTPNLVEVRDNLLCVLAFLDGLVHVLIDRTLRRELALRFDLEFLLLLGNVGGDLVLEARIRTSNATEELLPRGPLLNLFHFVLERLLSLIFELLNKRVLELKP